MTERPNRYVTFGPQSGYRVHEGNWSTPLDMAGAKHEESKGTPLIDIESFEWLVTAKGWGKIKVQRVWAETREQALKIVLDEVGFDAFAARTKPHAD